MKKLKIFLDTSVYSAIVDERDPIRQNQTKEFWNNIGQYELYYSDIVSEEIKAVPIEALRNKLLSFLEKGIKVNLNKDVKDLTNRYIEEDLIPLKFRNDAVLIALTSVHSLDILVSWNFKHLVKRKTRLGVNLINLKEGYRAIDILAPPEL